MAEISPLRRRMIEDMTVRNLSPATQRSYLAAVSKLSRYFGRSPDGLELEDIRAFQVHLVAIEISWPALNQIVCALRFFYGVTLGHDAIPDRISYARQPSKLPVVLSADEVVRFLEAIPSLKSRTALTTVYAAGLRVSEVVLLKIADIDSQRMVIRVEQGKGGKDRYVMLSPQLLRILRTYWRLARPKRWLFPGRDDERPLVPNVLHAACRSACAAAGLSKQVTVHTLRHTFATHLLESGADVRIIQVLLGHASLASTARYTRVATKTISNTPSPLDRLRLEVVPQPSLSQMPGADAGPMARGSASRIAASTVLSCRLHTAGAWRRDRVPEQVHRLRDPVPHGGRDTRYHRGQSQASRRQARYDHGSSHLGPDPRHPLGRLSSRLLPTGAGALAAVPPAVLAGAGERLRGRQAAVLQQSRQPCRTASLRTSSRRTPAPRLGGLRQATIRQPRTGAGLSRPLYPSRCYRQQPAPLARRREGALHLERLPTGRHHQGDDTRCR